MRKLISILLVAFVLPAFAQDNKDELQQTKQKLQKEIDEYRQLLESTRKDKKKTMSMLSLINSKINARLRIIDNINREIRMIDDDIYKKAVEVTRLKKDLDTLKMQYARNMVYAYKNRSNYDYINFIFSATSFNDAYRRMTYLKAYRAYREQQAVNILNTQQLLKQKIDGLNQNKKKKGEVLGEQNNQLGVLEDDKKEKDQIVKELKSREKEINNQIASRKVQQRKIDNAITAIIERERKESIARAKKEAEDNKKREAADAAANKANNNNNAATNKTTGTTVVKTAPAVTKVGTPGSYAPESADIAMSGRFEENRGKLPWPVDGANSFISMHYGQQDLEGVKYYNNAVTFQTGIGNSVKAIFDGVVSYIIDLGDGKQAVFLRHGKYITGYSGLASVSVSKGQEVKTGQVLGRAGANDEGAGETELRISPMDKGGYLNPEIWIRKGK